MEVPAIEYNELSGHAPAESSAQIKERVERARQAQMSHKQIQKFCALGKNEHELLKTAMAKLRLSARAYDKILRVSRTIADLAGSIEVKTEHVAEAIQYRSLDRGFFV